MEQNSFPVGAMMDRIVFTEFLSTYRLQLSGKKLLQNSCITNSHSFYRWNSFEKMPINLQLNCSYLFKHMLQNSSVLHIAMFVNNDRLAYNAHPPFIIFDFGKVGSDKQKLKPLVIG